MSMFGHMVDISLTKMRPIDGVLELWGVRGIDNTFFPTKIVAEQAARTTFSKDGMSESYGRISFVRFYRED